MSKFTSQIREIINVHSPIVSSSNPIDSYNLSQGQRARVRLRPTREQWRHLAAFAMFLIGISVAYQFAFSRPFLYPFELISTVFHEFGHALMTIVTGGRVAAIEINPNESGVTRFVGGVHCLILPAGYIGSSLAGAMLLILSFGKRSAEFAAVGTISVLLATIYWSGSVFTFFSSLIMAAALICLLCLSRRTAADVSGSKSTSKVLQLFILFMGVMGSIVSLLSISSHLITNNIDGSDAVEFAKNCSIFVPSSVYGVAWLAISLAMTVGSLLLGLYIYK